LKRLKLRLKDRMVWVEAILSEQEVTRAPTSIAATGR
jgi:hypothetical protein